MNNIPTQEEFRNRVALNLKFLRSIKKVDIEQVSKDTGINENNLNNYENAKGDIIDLFDIVTLCEYFKAPMKLFTF